jgi:phage-related minor tail protein
MGKGGVGLGVAELADKINQSTAAFKKHEDGLKRFGDLSDNLKSSMDNLKIAFSDLVSPFIGEGKASVEKFKIALLAIASVAVVNQLTKIVGLFIALNKAMATGAKIAGTMAALSGAKGIALVGGAVAAYAVLNKILEDPEEKIAQLELDKKSEQAKLGKGIDATVIRNIARIEKEIASLQTKIPDRGNNLTPPDTTKEDEETKDASKAQRDSDSARAKNAAALALLKIMDRENQLKIEGLTTDKWALEIKKADIEFEKEKAKILADYVADKIAAKDSVELEAVAEEKATIALNTAYKKAEGAKNFAAASRNKEIEDLKRQTKLQEELYEFEKKASDLRLLAVTTGDYEIQAKTILLEKEKAISQIITERNEKLRPTGQSAAAIAAIESEANSKIARAEIDAAARDVLRIANKEKEFRILDAQSVTATRLHEFDLAKIALEDKRIYLTDLEYKKQNELLELNKRLLELEQERLAVIDKYGVGERADKERTRIDEAIGREKELSAARNVSMENEATRQRSFVEGWDYAFRQYSTNALNAFKSGEEAFASLTSNMERTLDQFVSTGKLSFKDLASSIIKDLIRIQMRAQITSMFGGLKSLFGGELAGTAGITDGAVAGTYIPFGLAEGGPIAANTPYMVGERGPELIIPKGAGTVIPNNQLAGAMSGPQITYNGPYIANMQAIDTQSATQFLARNKLSVYAANQSAARSLPTSR